MEVLTSAPLVDTVLDPDYLLDVTMNIAGEVGWERVLVAVEHVGDAEDPAIWALRRTGGGRTSRTELRRLAQDVARLAGVPVKYDWQARSPLHHEAGRIDPPTA
ncbi:hypothetical protein [Demequina sp.]|uniref:hypothetical protein n=1 Tax=Demequina sp. TaxID=2050685 RepID=UPI003A8B9576